MFVLFFVQKNTFFCLFVQLWLWRTLYESWILLSLNSRRTQYIPIQTLKFYFLNSFFAFILSLRSFVHTHTYWLVKNGCERALNEFVVVFFLIFFFANAEKIVSILWGLENENDFTPIHLHLIDSFSCHSKMKCVEVDTVGGSCCSRHWYWYIMVSQFTMLFPCRRWQLRKLIVK